MCRIIIIIVFFSLTKVYSQEFDLLKSFEKGKSIIYTYVKEGSSNNWGDTITTETFFNGKFQVYVDNITISLLDSIRTYSLRIHKKGTESIRNIKRNISEKEVDLYFLSSIKENLKKNYRSGKNYISGWIIPDSTKNVVCSSNNNNYYYRYPKYYRFYNFPSVDTFDVKHDTLTLQRTFTDCRDFSRELTIIVNQQNGLVELKKNIYSYMDWSTTETYKFVSVSSVEKKNTSISNSFTLFQNFPNPFNPQTTLSFRIIAFDKYSLKIYDVAGQEIMELFNKYLSPGIYNYVFDGSKYSSGLYMYVISSNKQNLSKKMILVK